MTSELIIPLLGGAGFLAGIAALLSWWNTRKPVRQKGDADAYTAYSSFAAGAITQAQIENTRLTVVVRLLVDLALDLIALARRRGSPPEELDAYQDRLDDARATRAA